MVDIVILEFWECEVYIRFKEICYKFEIIV